MAINIQLDAIYDEIYRKAEPYLDTRQNAVHVSLSYDFACRLLDLYPTADIEIVLPAIILHDVGWKKVPEEKQLSAFGPKAKDKKRNEFMRQKALKLRKKF